MDFLHQAISIFVAPVAFLSHALKNEGKYDKTSKTCTPDVQTNSDVAAPRIITHAV